MAREFGGNAERLLQASVAKVSRMLAINPGRWTSSERASLENWSLVLALVPDLNRWSPEEKRKMIQIIRAQSGLNEMRYLYLTQRHPLLRRALLRLGTAPTAG